MNATVEQIQAREILTADQAAELLGIRPQTLSVWRLRGKGPSFLKCGRCVRYRRADIEKWLQGCAVKCG